MSRPALESLLVVSVLAMGVGVAVMAARVHGTREAATVSALPLASVDSADRENKPRDDTRILVASAGAALDVPIGNRDPARIAHILASRSAGTYFGELMSTRDSVNFRWPDRRGEPMRVWVQQSPLEGFDPGYPGLVREAFTTWQRAGVPIYFSFALDSTRAEIRVTWVDRFDERMTGRTRWAYDRNEWIVGGSIELALHQPNGTPLDRDAVRAIALHEVGHLIGLDHATSEANVMSARVRVAELSDADGATARLVYALPPGSLRAASADSVSSAGSRP